MSTIASTAPTSWKWTLSTVDAVNLRLRFSQPFEAGDRPGADFAGQGGSAQQGDDVREMPPVRLSPGDVHVHPRSRHAAGTSPLRLEAIPGERQTFERLAQLLLRAGKGEQRRRRHVPGDPGEAIEVKEAAHSRLITDARTPAPNPLSMLTTATVGEQELSIPRSAATPPKAAP